MAGELVAFQPVAAHLSEDYPRSPLPEDDDDRVATLNTLVQTSDDDPVLASLCKLLCSLLKVPAAGTRSFEAAPPSPACMPWAMSTNARGHATLHMRISTRLMWRFFFPHLLFMHACRGKYSFIIHQRLGMRAGVCAGLCHKVWSY